MTTEIITEVSYQIQTLGSNGRWINWGAIFADKIRADKTIRLVRHHYPESLVRMTLITTTTEVIA